MTPTARAEAPGRRWPAYGRRAVATLVVLGCGLALLLGPPSTCRDAVAGDRVVQLCEPLGVTSPVVLLALLVIALLLLPDLAEVQVAGLLTLRREVADARAEAARALAATSKLEAQLASAATAGAAAASAAASGAVSGSTSASDQHVTVEQHLHVDRSAATAEVLDEALRGDVVLDQPGEDVGAAAMVALQATLLGLGQLIREDGVPVPVLGLVADTSGALSVAHDYHGWDPADVAEVQRAVTGGLGQTLATSTAAGRRVVLAPARAADGRVVGALAADCGRTSPSDVHPERDTGWENVIAAVEVAAGAYAQVLTDLLGERDR